MNEFQKKLEIGKAGESLIAKYLINKGYAVLPVYEKEQGEYKGPVLFKENGQQTVAPDMLVFKKDKTLWIEAKYKTAFAWHRNKKIWTTGIDRHHFYQYLDIANDYEHPVWILFLHSDGVAKDTPEGMVSPTGLFGGEINFLKDNIDHEHSNWGRYGMVYWSHDALKLIEPLEAFWQTIST